MIKIYFLSSQRICCKVSCTIKYNSYRILLLSFHTLRSREVSLLTLMRIFINTNNFSFRYDCNSNLIKYALYLFRMLTLISIWFFRAEVLFVLLFHVIRIMVCWTIDIFYRVCLRLETDLIREVWLYIAQHLVQRFPALVNANKPFNNEIGIKNCHLQNVTCLLYMPDGNTKIYNIVLNDNVLVLS